MSDATERIRAMLDERGVGWRKAPHYSSESQDNETIFEGNGIEWHANDHMNGRLGLRALKYEVTPEQAIEATLGRGECRLIPTRDKPRSKAPTLTCSECGWWTDRINDELRYCPRCGKRVKA